MRRLAQLWGLLNTPSRFDGDPYGGFLNQWGHYTGGAVAFIVLCGAFFFLDGEMPPRYVAAGALVLAYAVLIEWRTQGWRGMDSVEDALFVAMGVLTFASSVTLLMANGWQIVILVDMLSLLAGIFSALIACVAYP